MNVVTAEINNLLSDIIEILDVNPKEENQENSNVKSYSRPTLLIHIKHFF